MSITISHSSAEGTLVQGDTRPHKDTIKTQGLRWSSRERFWYVRGSRDRQPNTALIERLATALRDAGATVDVQVDTTLRPVAEVEADRAQRAEERAAVLAGKADRLAARSDAQWNDYRERVDRIPFGQPILVGHHSEQRDRRYRERASRRAEQAIETDRAAQHTARRAEAAEATQAHRQSGPTTERRIKTLEAEHRKLRRALDGHTRTIAKGTALYGRADWVETTPPATGAHRERVEERLGRCEEELAYWRQHLDHLIEAGEYKRWRPEDFQPGDLVKAIGQWHKVVRVNAKSLTVPNPVGGDWTSTLPYDKVTDHQRPAAGVDG